MRKWRGYAIFSVLMLLTIASGIKMASIANERIGVCWNTTQMTEKTARDCIRDGYIPGYMPHPGPLVRGNFYLKPLRLPQCAYKFIFAVAKMPRDPATGLHSVVRRSKVAVATFAARPWLGGFAC